MKKNSKEKLLARKVYILNILICDIWFVLIHKCLWPLYVKNIAGTFRTSRNVRKQPAVYV